MTALKVEKKKLQQWFKKGLKMYLASQVHVFALYLVVNSVSNRDNLSFRYMGIGLSAQGVNMNRLPGKLYDCYFDHM